MCLIFEGKTELRGTERVKGKMEVGPERRMSNSKKKDKMEDKEKPKWVEMLEKKLMDRGPK